MDKRAEWTIRKEAVNRDRSGRFVLMETRSGKQKTVRSGATSNAVIDAAASKHGELLRRLAKR